MYSEFQSGYLDISEIIFTQPEGMPENRRTPQDTAEHHRTLLKRPQDTAKEKLI